MRLWQDAQAKIHVAALDFPARSPWQLPSVCSRARALVASVKPDLIHTHQKLMAALAFTIAKFCVAHHDATDTDVLAAVQALAETTRTLTTGIYYEKQPDGLVRRELYAALAAFAAEVKQKQAEQGLRITLPPGIRLREPGAMVDDCR